MTLDILKSRLGVGEGITVYDDELSALLLAAESDIEAAGVPSWLISADDARVQLAVTAFVKAHYGDDRQNRALRSDACRRADAAGDALWREQKARGQRWCVLL